MSKSFPTVHKLDASSRENIASSVKRSRSLSLSLSTRLREIFFLPLGSRVLIGQRNFEGIVFWERAYMRVYTPRGAVIGTGFRTSRFADLENSGSRTNHWSLENFSERWMIVDVTFLCKVSTSNLSLYI